MDFLHRYSVFMEVFLTMSRVGATYRPLMTYRLTFLTPVMSPQWPGTYCGTTQSGMNVTVTVIINLFIG